MKFINLMKYACTLTLTVTLITGCSESKSSSSPDTTAPGEVTLTGISMMGNTMALTWTEPDDSDYDHIVVTWSPGGTSGTELDAGTADYGITGLTLLTEYTVTITTVDTSGNQSDGASFTIVFAPTVSPKLIYTADDLNAIRGGEPGYTGWDMTGYYIVMDDIDLSSSSYSTWEPLGSGTAFTGTFDGNDHTISGLTIDTTGNYAGLFGITGDTGIIKSIHLENVSIQAQSYVGGVTGFNTGEIDDCTTSGTIKAIEYDVDEGFSSGGIAGENRAPGSVTGCTSSADVSADTYNSGGLVGYNNSTITGSSASGVVTGNISTGGLVGQSDGGTITGSYATGTVNGNEYTGGLAGYSNCAIETSYATGVVTATGDYTGGLVGFNNATIEDSYATGNVSGIMYTGGLAGFNVSAVTGCHADGNVTGEGSQIGGLVGRSGGGAASITECYATGNVSGGGTSPLQYIGGLVGYQHTGTISQSYSTGNVTGKTNDSYIGGLVGINYGIISESYAGGSISGLSNIGGLVGQLYEGAISNSYAVGSASGTDYVGGLIGRIYNSTPATVEYCYAAASVSNTFNHGGLTGDNYGGTGIITDCFYDRTVSGYDADGGTGWYVAGTATSTADMQDQSTYPVGWDFTSPGTWDISATINSGYPYLQDLEP